MTITDSDAKAILDELSGELGLSPEESLAVRLVGKHETKYGQAWKGEGVDSNNWGADTTSSQDPGDSFGHGDSRYDPETGKVVQYQTRFAKYETPKDGARGLARVLLFQGSSLKKPRRENVAAALANRSILQLATAMRQNRYYLGVKPFAGAVEDYRQALERAYRDIAQDTGEKLFDHPLVQGAQGAPGAQAGDSGLPPSSVSAYLQRLSRSLPVLRLGNRGDLVGVLQFELGRGLTPDEHFGPRTERAVREFQEDHGIETEVSPEGKPLPAGVVGVKTWALLFAGDELGAEQ